MGGAFSAPGLQRRGSSGGSTWRGVLWAQRRLFALEVAAGQAHSSYRVAIPSEATTAALGVEVRATAEDALREHCFLLGNYRGG